MLALRQGGEKRGYAISVDTLGKLRWSSGDLDGDHLICVVSERAPDDYVAMLRHRGVSYVVTGAPAVDLARARSYSRRSLASARCCSKAVVTSKVTPAQLALAWLLAQKPWIAPIPGTTKLKRLDENLGGAALELTPADLREIDCATSKIKLQGARYPERLERMTGR